ncbi:MAG: hypothetical protein ACYC1Q_10605 [Bacteroidia bacterium]
MGEDFNNNRIAKIAATILFSLLTTILARGQADTVFMRYDNLQFEGEKIVYTTDTFLFDSPRARTILVGTTILPWTGNQQNAKGCGLYLNKVEIAPCRNGERPKEKEEVNLVTQSDSTLIISLSILGNCCHSFLCDVQVVNDSTINLIQYGYGASYCACTCCFGLSYEFSLLRGSSEFEKLMNVMINGDERTLKLLK